MTASGATYRSEIDGLRAVAILLVSVFHFRLLPMGEAGFIGVDVFFVISGYLITRLLIRDLDAGQFSFKRFYLARFRRLMPALVATLALYFAFATFVFLPEQFRELSIEALLTQFYAVNFYFWRTINYFGLRADDVPLLHMWSLAIEEQFYLIYPVLLFFIFRLKRAFLLPVLALITAASFLLGWWATGWKPEASFYLLPTRAWELGAGACLAMIQPRPTLDKALANISGLFGAALIVLALFIHTPVTAFPGWFAALPVAGAVLLILSGPTSLSGKLLSLPPMLWIGWISYPLYLVHWPVIQLMRSGLPEFSIGYRWLGFAVSIAVACIIWRFVENPVRRGVFFDAPRRLLGTLGGATVALISICLLGALTHGLPARISTEARAILAHADELPWQYMSCEYEPPRDVSEGCTLGDPEAPATVALIGDSHAQALAGAFDQYLKARGEKASFLFYHGCRPVFGYGTEGCRRYTEAMVSNLSDESSIAQVIMVSTWKYKPRPFDGVYLRGSAADAAFAEKLDQTLNALKRPGRQVVLVDPMYAAMSNVPERMARNIMFGRDLPIDRPLELHKRGFEALFDIFDNVSAVPDVVRVSLIDDLCADGTCKATLDGKPLFRDGNHIRFGVSDYFAKQLARVLDGS